MPVNQAGLHVTIFSGNSSRAPCRNKTHNAIDSANLVSESHNCLVTIHLSFGHDSPSFSFDAKSFLCRCKRAGLEASKCSQGNECLEVWIFVHISFTEPRTQIVKFGCHVLRLWQSNKYFENDFCGYRNVDYLLSPPTKMWVVKRIFRTLLLTRWKRCPAKN